jgi:hypothetical protein
MKRDMDIIRRILLAVRDSDTVTREVEGVSPLEFGLHAQLIVEAGLATGSIATGKHGMEVKAALLFRLTWAGHDFADSVQDDNVWHKAKKRLMGPSLSWTFDILREVVAAIIKDGLKL